VPASINGQGKCSFFLLAVFVKFVAFKLHTKFN
jgi:hypothetical protein